MTVSSHARPAPIPDRGTIRRLRLFALPVAACLGLIVASCSSFSGYVADHWPHWAGGEPEDVPPRPGSPGYEEFIAHGQASQTNQTNRDVTTTAAVPAGDKSDAATASPPAPAADNGAVVQGGLY